MIPDIDLFGSNIVHISCTCVRCNENCQRDYISIEGHHYCVVHIRIGNDLSMRVHPDEVDLFELHRRFFEILAEGEGMTLTSWGDNCHVRWDGTLWGVEA